MVARGVGAAGPVLLACRQWDPRGLARRLPSLGAGAWRGAPLLPWRVQCPGRVCAALAASSGGPGRFLVSCLPRFPLPAPRVLRCVWRGVTSGCPLSSLAGTPFHAVCAFCGLGPVALLVFPACPLCVCALALSRRPLPSPPLPRLVWRAHLARSRCWALVGPFHAVRAPPRVLPRSRAPFGVLGGGGGPVPFPPFLAWGCALPAGWVCAPGASLRRGVGWGGGGGGGLCAVPSDCAVGGASGVGGRLASFRPSAFPGQATKRVSLASLWPWRAWPPYRSGSCSRAVSGRGPCGVLARWHGFACSSWFLREQASGAGGVGLAPAPLSGVAVLSGGGGAIPSASGGWGLAPLWLAGRWGGGAGGQGGSRCGSPALPLGGGLWPPSLPPFRRARSVGAAGQPRAPGAACLAGGGGGGGAACETPPPEAPTDPIRPSALPERVSG